MSDDFKVTVGHVTISASTKERAEAAALAIAEGLEAKADREALEEQVGFFKRQVSGLNSKVDLLRRMVVAVADEAARYE